MPATAGGCPTSATLVADINTLVPVAALSLLQPAKNPNSRLSPPSSLPFEPAVVDPPAPPLAAALACRRSDPTIGGRKARPHAGLDPIASLPAGRPSQSVRQSPELVALASPEVAGGDRFILPVHPGWVDWRGCFHGDEAVLESEFGKSHTISKGHRSPPPTTFCRPFINVRCSPPVWLRDRCFRCLCRGHCTHSSRDPIRCTDCLRSGHIARFCRAKKHVHPSLPLQCHAPSPASTGDVSMLDVHFQSVSAQQVGLGEESEMLRNELRECLARVESVLGRVEAALAKPEVVPDVSSMLELQIGVVSDVSLLTEIQVVSVNEEVGIYGDLSPRATTCWLPLPVVSTASRSEVVVEVVPLVLQIMPELQKFCGEPTPPISMVLPEETRSLGADLTMSIATSSSLSELGQPLAFMDRGGLAATIALSP
ncbi:hypothetical protein ZWY2020_044828 [Hordeum vulgare]|nr:hypothetical protein ZWY2020_044828 [Hordeum vulgare]